MEEFIEQINERIAKLQEDPTDVNIGKISELHLVRIRLHQLTLSDDNNQREQLITFLMKVGDCYDMDRLTA